MIRGSLASGFQLWLVGLIMGLCTLGNPAYLPAQEQELEIPEDSLLGVDFQNYLQGVLQYHPVSRQSDLLRQQAAAALQAARGGFDPILYGDYDDKYFKKTNYWRIFEGGLSVPTPFGVELKAGYYFQDGEFVNTERSIPDDGQILLGAKLPLGQGLVIDGRRAALRQAKIFQESNELARQLQLNDLLFDAAIAFWDWSLSYTKLQRFLDGVEAARGIYEGVKATFEAGDAAGIDTVDAFTQLQQVRIAVNEAQLEVEMRRLEASNFLWDVDQQPILLPANFVPENLMESLPEPSDVFDYSLNLLDGLERHPQLREIELKLASLEVERKFKADKLKPKLDLNYNILSSTVTGEGISSTYSLDRDNYKWGLSLTFPLFLRQERGALNLTKVKIRDTELYQDSKALELGNKILAYAEQVQVYAAQVQRIDEQVLNYQRLYEAEIQKFRAGESDLFKVNARQQKLLETQQKQLDIAFKFQKAPGFPRLDTGPVVRA